MSEVKGHLGSVSFDGQVVVIHKKLRSDTRVQLRSIGSVSIERAGIGMRAIRFAVNGGTLAGKPKPLGRHRDEADDPYALTFRAKRQPEFEALIAEVESALAAV